MADTLLPKRRSADATAPTTANLVDGEFAVNSVSKTIYQRVGGSIVAIANYFSGAFSDLTGKPTTLAGYGITDAALDANVVHTTGAENVGGAKTFITSPLTVAPGGAAQFKADANSGSVADFVWMRVGAARWYMRMRNNAETGSDAGSDFQFVRKTDAGSDISVFNIARSDGVVNFAANPVVSGNAIWHAGSAYITVGTQSGGGVGLLRLEDAAGARSSWTITGSRRWSAGNNGTGWTLRDESGSVNAITVSAGGNAAFSGSITAGGNTVWHAGNDGAGSGLDADTVDGYQVAEASTVSTVVARNSSGDIQARLFRSEYTATNSDIGAIMTQVNIGTTTNNYIRPSTPAQVASALLDEGSIGYRNVPLTTTNANYTFTTADVGKSRMHTDGTVRTWTIPNVFAAGDVLTIVNSAAVTLTLTGSGGVNLYLAPGTGGAGNRTVGKRSVVTVFFITTTDALVYGLDVS